MFVNIFTKILPCNFQIDRNGMIWVLSDRLPIFMYQPDQLDRNDYNFRILTGNVREAIQGTVCSMNSFDRSITSRPSMPTTNNNDFKAGISKHGSSPSTAAGYDVAMTAVLVLALATTLIVFRR